MNISWKHGVNALTEEEKKQEQEYGRVRCDENIPVGRISIILWGQCEHVIEEEGSPPMLSDGKGHHMHVANYQPHPHGRQRGRSNSRNRHPHHMPRHDPPYEQRDPSPRARRDSRDFRDRDLSDRKRERSWDDRRYGHDPHRDDFRKQYRR